MAETKPKSDQKADATADGVTYFVWENFKTARKIVLAQKKEISTSKGKEEVPGSGKEIYAKYGFYKTNDEAIIKAMQEHKSFNHPKRDYSFRFATADEVTIFSALAKKKIPEQEWMQRAKDSVAALDPKKKVK